MRGRTLILRNTGLFEGIEDDEMETMLKCLGAFTRRYAKDEFLFRRGDRTDCLGVILSGNVREIREDWWGNRTVLADVGKGQVVKNLMRSLAGMSLGMNRRLDQLSKRSTREKICAFLSDQARAAGSSDFIIGMNRQEMADYLGVDRSAMSTELGKMQRDGILEFQRNHFVLK